MPTKVDRIEKSGRSGHPAAKQAPSSQGGVRYQEMSPEVTLVEFISTSASFHGVKRENIKQLEWDILKVFPNNIMPANAAAWYMAKRRFYMGNSDEYQLLPFLLKNYPKKFEVKDSMVEFLEVYNKDAARRKLHQMIHQGLVAYFNHKVDEYGVYFFDPYYYQMTEPFHANLRHVTNIRTGNAARLLPTFFDRHKDQFVYKEHSQYLVTISREPVDIRVNTTGIIIAMIDNQFGILQFPSGNGTEKALFSAKALFRDGWVYQGDPMKLPPLEFDGYRIPNTRAAGKRNFSYSWYAVLVWCGRKPSPKYCATRDDLTSSPYFQNSSAVPGVTYDEFVARAKSGHEARKSLSRLERGALCVQVGEVLAIRNYGAVVSLGKDSEERAFIPGWKHKNLKFPGTFLTTTQGVELALKDLITFCIDPNREEEGFKAVGCNVTVLKHASDKKSTNVNGTLPFTLAVDDPMKLRMSGMSMEHPNFTTGVSIENSNQDKKKRRKQRRNSAKKSPSKKSGGTSSESNGRKKDSGLSGTSEEDSEAQTNDSKKTTSKRKKRASSKATDPMTKGYVHFLLSSDIEPDAAYDSDQDPAFEAVCHCTFDLDFDEYSDGEIEDEERSLLLEDLTKVVTRPEPEKETSGDEATGSADKEESSEGADKTKENGNDVNKDGPKDDSSGNKDANEKHDEIEAPKGTKQGSDKNVDEVRDQGAAKDPMGNSGDVKTNSTEEPKA